MADEPVQVIPKSMPTTISGTHFSTMTFPRETTGVHAQSSWIQKSPNKKHQGKCLAADMIYNGYYLLLLLEGGRAGRIGPSSGH